MTYWIDEKCYNFLNDLSIGVKHPPVPSKLHVLIKRGYVRKNNGYPSGKDYYTITESGRLAFSQMKLEQEKNIRANMALAKQEADRKKRMVEENRQSEELQRKKIAARNVMIQNPNLSGPYANGGAMNKPYKPPIEEIKLPGKMHEYSICSWCQALIGKKKRAEAERQYVNRDIPRAVTEKIDEQEHYFCDQDCANIYRRESKKEREELAFRDLCENLSLDTEGLYPYDGKEYKITIRELSKSETADDLDDLPF